MGQQQLLLLVLATVIVGLATVAGIQAFSEGQAQASQDALVQRGTGIASDLLGAHDKPSQLGGITLASDGSPGTWANAIGQPSATIDAPGAGDGGECTIEAGTGESGSFDLSSVDATVDCENNGGANVVVGIDADASGDRIETAIVSSASV
ncbi:hypothetical protein [Salinibacter pepae]|uniref:hypothetical protein n=1 Tax=Salinibacter pepae TaxID=3040382 RepID=UPI0021E8471F|nr:hypothetical protein [Salinibacter pepae]